MDCRNCNTLLQTCIPFELTIETVVRLLLADFEGLNNADDDGEDMGEGTVSWIFRDKEEVDDDNDRFTGVNDETIAAVAEKENKLLLDTVFVDMFIHFSIMVPGK